MALTQQQWHDKLEKFVPSWYFEEVSGLADAVFWGAAAIFQAMQQDVDDAQASTFITKSSAPILDLLGDERSIERNIGESDSTYAPRIQTGLFVSVSLAELEDVINGCLNVTPAFFIQNLEYGFYDDADITEADGVPYYDDYWTRWLDLTKWYNWWTVIIPVQNGGIDASIQAALTAGIEQNIALGTTYDIMYGDDFNAGGDFLTESGDDFVTESGDNFVLE